jgi:hypothetical protein
MAFKDGNSIISPRRDVFLAFIAFLVAFALWQVQGLYFLTYPLRLFVTMIHELGHGVSAILTGGEFVKFEVSKRGAGLAYTRPGLRFFIIQAGYLGTAVFGATLLFLTNRTKRPGYVAIGVGILIGILTLLFTGISLASLTLFETIITTAVIIAAIYLILTRDTDEGRYAGLAVLAVGGIMLAAFTVGDNLLTILVGLASALILILIGFFANRDVTVVTLNFLAFLTGLQAITDSWILLKIVSLPESMMPRNDASTMADEYFGTAGVWALLWVMLDILIFGTAVYYTFIKPAREGRQSAASGA